MCGTSGRVSSRPDGRGDGSLSKISRTFCRSCLNMSRAFRWRWVTCCSRRLWVSGVRSLSSVGSCIICKRAFRWRWQWWQMDWTMTVGTFRVPKDSPTGPFHRYFQCQSGKCQRPIATVAFRIPRSTVGCRPGNFFVCHQKQCSGSISLGYYTRCRPDNSWSPHQCNGLPRACNSCCVG